MAQKKQLETNGVAELFLTRQKLLAGTAPCDEDFSQRFPKLFSLLTNLAIDESQASEPTSLRITNNGGDWLVSVYVPGGGCSRSVQVRTMAEAFLALEAAVGTGPQDWKYDLRHEPKVRKVRPPKKMVDS